MGEMHCGVMKDPTVERICCARLQHILKMCEKAFPDNGEEPYEVAFVKK